MTAILMFAIAACVFCALAGTTAMSTEQPAKAGAPLSVRYLPAGQVCDIVLVSDDPVNGRLVFLKTSKGTFPIMVQPKATTIVPFPCQWVVQLNEGARLESPSAPFKDAEQLVQTGAQPEDPGVHAWIVTDRGPVQMLAAPPTKGRVP